jgi:hypothetical protein
MAASMETLASCMNGCCLRGKGRAEEWANGGVTRERICVLFWGGGGEGGKGQLR